MGWIAVAFLPLSLTTAMAVGGVLFVIELLGPFIAERHGGTPWHPHHIAERCSLLAIITLGEGIIGTVSALSALVTTEHWTGEAVLVVVAGIGLTFGLWWVYFVFDSGDILHHHRERSFAFGYLHLPLFASIAAVGAGLHVAGYWLVGEAHLAEAGVVAAVAIPVAVFVALVMVIYRALSRGGAGGHGVFHTLLVVLTFGVIAGGVALGAAGVPLGVCLLVVMLGPFVTVVGFELFGHRLLDADRRVLVAGAGASSH